MGKLEKFQLFSMLFSSLVLILLYNRPAQGGFRGFLCPEDENFNKNSSCNDGCQEGYNALYGFCGDAKKGDFNCYCTPPLPQRRRPPGHDCLDPEDYRYDLNCRIACQCVQNALGGFCDYRQKTCNCVGQNQDPSSLEYCPFKNWQTYETFRRNLGLIEVPPHPQSKNWV